VASESEPAVCSTAKLAKLDCGHGPATPLRHFTLLIHACSLRCLSLGPAIDPRVRGEQGQKLSRFPDPPPWRWGLRITATICSRMSRGHAEAEPPRTPSGLGSQRLHVEVVLDVVARAVGLTLLRRAKR
jgi:hypothetical protein